MIAIDLEVHENAFFEDKIINPPWKNWRIVEAANVHRRFREKLTLDFKNVKFFVYNG